MDEQALERELAPPRQLRDDYPKTLLTLDRIGLEDHNCIEQRHIVGWLSE